MYELLMCRIIINAYMSETDSHNTERKKNNILPCP